MYPHVTQFETRDRLVLDELRLRAERRAASRPRAGRPSRAGALRLTLARMLRLA